MKIEYFHCTSDHAEVLLGTPHFFSYRKLGVLSRLSRSGSGNQKIETCLKCQWKEVESLVIPASHCTIASRGFNL